MAYKKRSMRRRSHIGKRKRSLRRRVSKRQKQPLASIVRMSTIPDRAFVKLRYVDVMEWTVGVSGTVQSPVYFNTSLYQPRGAAGHQPYWYDQWTPSVYTKYRVYGLKYDITVTNSGSLANWWFAVRPQNTPVAENNLQTLLERKDTKFRIGTNVNGQGDKLRIKGYLSTSKTLGLTNTEIKNDAYYAADYNGNPIKQAFLYCYIAHMDSAAVKFGATATITYMAELFNRAVPPAS